MKSHREFIEDQMKDVDFRQAYEEAKQAVVFAVTQARLRDADSYPEGYGYDGLPVQKRHFLASAPNTSIDP
jgi:hypothetical protein